MSLKSSGDKEGGGVAAAQKLANSLSPEGGDKKRLTLLSNLKIINFYKSFSYSYCLWKNGNNFHKNVIKN